MNSVVLLIKNKFIARISLSITCSSSVIHFSSWDAVVCEPWRNLIVLSRLGNKELNLICSMESCILATVGNIDLNWPTEHIIKRRRRVFRDSTKTKFFLPFSPLFLKWSWNHSWSHPLHYVSISEWLFCEFSEYRWMNDEHDLEISFGCRYRNF